MTATRAPASAAGARRRLLALGVGALALGIALRLLAAATRPLFFDEARVGLMARGVLAGEFPFFFHGQAFMGAAEAYVHAPVLGLLGPSTMTLRAGAILVSLLHVAAVGLLAGRVFGDGRRAALLALVPSAYLLKWAIDPRLHYGLVLVLVPLCLALALRAADPGAAAAARTRALLALALVGGLGWWINVLTAAALVPCVLLLLVRRPRLRGLAVLAPAALLVGSAPAWLFGLVHGRLPALTVPLTWADAPEHARELLRRGLPHLAGVPHRVVEGDAGAAVAAAVGLVLGLGLALALGPRAARRDGQLLVAGTAALSVLPVLVTERGLTLATEDPRYLLPVLALLPVVVGGAVVRLHRARPAWAGAAVALVVVLHVAGVAKAHPHLRTPARWHARRADVVRTERLAGDLAARRLTAVYTHDPDVLAFLSGGRITVSHFYLDDDPLAARRVDAAPGVAYLAAQVPPGFEASLRAAGVRFSRAAIGARTLYTDFALEHAAYREIAPAGWRATADPRPELAAQATDRDAGTQWRTAGRPAGARIEVDLGRVHPLGMIAWLPGGYREVPLGFRVETSADGRDWTLAREVPTYYGPLYWAGGHPMGRVRWGRVEVRFPPRPARHLRITHLGADERIPWTVRELFAYEAVPPAAQPIADAGAAARALAARGVRRVHADHGHGPRLVEAAAAPLRAVPDNVRVDRYGLTPSLDRLPALELAEDTAIVHPAGAPSGPAIETALREAGLRFAGEEAGGYRLLTRLGPGAPPGRLVRPDAAAVTAEPAGGAPPPVVDGRAGTRWSTGRPQRAGDRLELALAGPADLAGLELDLGEVSFQYPRALAVQVAREGAGWEEVPATPAWVGPLVWTGTHVLRAGVERVRLTFPTVRARAIRVIQTARDGVAPWSVAEVRLIVP